MPDFDDPRCFPPVEAEPYPWPFDGIWSSANTALLLLGFQKQAVELFDAHDAVDNVGMALEQCRKAGLPVVFSRHGHDGYASPLIRRRSLLGDEIPMRHSEPWQLVLEPHCDAGDVIVDHGGDDAFYRTGLALSLRSRNIRNILIAGLPTDGLVHATMRSANDAGFECLAISDACRGTSLARHDAQLAITKFGNGLFGTVASSAAVIAALSANDKDLLP